MGFITWILTFLLIRNFRTLFIMMYDMLVVIRECCPSCSSQLDKHCGPLKTILEDTLNKLDPTCQTLDRCWINAAFHCCGAEFSTLQLLYLIQSRPYRCGIQTCTLPLMLAKLLVTWHHDLLKVSLPSCMLLSPLSVSGPGPACHRVWGRLRKAGPRAQVVIPHRSLGSTLWLPPALLVLPYQTLLPPYSPPSISISPPHVPVKIDYCTRSHSPAVKTWCSVSHFQY